MNYLNRFQNNKGVKSNKGILKFESSILLRTGHGNINYLSRILQHKKLLKIFYLYHNNSVHIVYTIVISLLGKLGWISVQILPVHGKKMKKPTNRLPIL